MICNLKYFWLDFIERHDDEGEEEEREREDEEWKEKRRYYEATG